MKKLVIIGVVFPEPNSTAAGERILQLIDFFLAENYKITFLSSAKISEHSFDFSTKKIEIQTIYLNDSEFEKIIKKLDPNIVIFDRFITEEQFSWRVSEICPNALKILDTEDLHFLRKAREKAFKQNINLTKKELISDFFKREIAAMLRCDFSLIISEFEMNFLIKNFKIDENILFYLPLFATINPSKKTFSERKNFISIGNFLHEPNWQTVLKIKQIWGSIKSKLPEAKIHIFGAYCTEKAYQLHSEKEGFLIKGRAESVEKCFSDVRVLLAPIPFGAGIKGKLLKSMQFGLPNITTSVGAEAMHENLPWNGFICDQDTDFVNQAVLLYENEKIWRKSQENGYEIIEKRFLKELFLSDFAKKIFHFLNHLQEFRNNNFLGEILQHHNLQSTKYMSKWIEEKHKKD